MATSSFHARPRAVRPHILAPNTHLPNACYSNPTLLRHDRCVGSAALNFVHNYTSMNANRVLIVDKSAENREVLTTILRRGGVETLEARQAETGLELAKKWHPRVLVLDSDTVDLDDASVCDGFDDEVRQENAAIVVLGRVCHSLHALATNEVVPKPYHYGPLIRKIEELLRVDANSSTSSEQT